MASSCGADADKGSLRSGYLAARVKIPRASRAASDASILATLEGLAPFREATVVLSYVSFGAEVDTRAIIASLLSRGRRVAVPRTDPRTRQMRFCEIGGLAELRPGAHAILEPAPGAPALGVADLVGSVCLVPGLVFDADGYRVGYGGGCYDRFLPFYPGEKVGLARRTQLSSNPLPRDAHDVPVDYLVTEGRSWDCRSCR